MIRLLILGVLGYGAYRVARQFVRSVPSDFEPLLIAPPESKRPARAETAQ